jgi:chemotaxis protein CheX
MNDTLLQTVGEPPGLSLVLPPSLDLTNADSLRRDLLDRLESDALRLDGSAVEQVTTPCLQVLAAAAVAAQARGIPFHLCGASIALSCAIAELGLVAAIPLED